MSSIDNPGDFIKNEGMTHPVKISLVLPVKNESENLAPLIEEIRIGLDGYVEYEVICVDDGSSDGSVEILQKIRSLGFSRLRIFRHPTSFGQTSAIQTGLQAARGEWIVTLDGDGQNNPADIQNLLEHALDPFKDDRLQLISGYRKKRKDRWITRVSSEIANKVRGGLLKDHTPDTGCGLKVIQKEAFLSLPYFDHMHRFLPALIQRQGGKVMIVEVDHRPRKHGRSNYGVFDRLWIGIVDLLGVMWLQRRTKIPSDIKEL